MTLDEELRQALVRDDPPDGFVDRTLERLTNESATNQREPRTDWRTPNRWVVLGLAASLIVAAAGAEMLRHQRTTREATRTVAELELGLRLASQALDIVRNRVAAATQREGASYDTP